MILLWSYCWILKRLLVHQQSLNLAVGKHPYPEAKHNSGVSTSIKAHNFARLLRGPLSISVASNSKLDLFPKSQYPERFYRVLDRI